jgi:hypothetical protein
MPRGFHIRTTTDVGRISADGAARSDLDGDGTIDQWDRDPAAVLCPGDDLSGGGHLTPDGRRRPVRLTHRADRGAISDVLESARSHRLTPSAPPHRDAVVDSGRLVFLLSGTGSFPTSGTQPRALRLCRGKPTRRHHGGRHAAFASAAVPRTARRKPRDSGGRSCLGQAPEWLAMGSSSAMPASRRRKEPRFVRARFRVCPPGSHGSSSVGRAHHAVSGGRGAPPGNHRSRNHSGSTGHRCDAGDRAAH